MKKLKDLGYKYKPKDGRKRFTGARIKSPELMNKDVIVLDYEKDVPTKNGNRTVIKLELDGKERKYFTSLEETLPKLDVLYMTRVQKERFFNEEDYVRLKDTYILNREKLNLAQPDMPVLHPLPRVDEIVSDVDQDPRAAYFDQVQNGKYIRMALIMALLEIQDPLIGRTVL